jgi:hypothetical protein
MNSVFSAHIAGMGIVIALEIMQAVAHWWGPLWPQCGKEKVKNCRQAANGS